MNEDNANNIEQTDLQPTDLEQRWNTLLCDTAQRTPASSTIVPVVLKALKAERERTGDGSSWARYLSSAAQLQRSDLDAVQPALQAVRLERHRVRQWRGSVTRWIASVAAVAAVVAAVAVFSPPLSADPTDAYSAYQEAARGW